MAYLGSKYDGALLDMTVPCYTTRFNPKINCQCQSKLKADLKVPTFPTIRTYLQQAIWMK